MGIEPHTILQQPSAILHRLVGAQGYVDPVDGHHDVGEITLPRIEPEPSIGGGKGTIGTPKCGQRVPRARHCLAQDGPDFLLHVLVLEEDVLDSDEPVVRKLQVVGVGEGGGHEGRVAGQRQLVHAFGNLVLIIMAFHDLPGLGQVLQDGHCASGGLPDYYFVLIIGATIRIGVKLGHSQRIINIVIIKIYHMLQSACSQYSLLPVSLRRFW